MRFFVLILAFAIASSLAYDPVFVDELEDLVRNKQDEWELDQLDDDDSMIRSVKKEKLDVILARQPEATQKRFEMEVEREKLRHQQKIQKRIAKTADPQIQEFWRQVEAINNDMSISENEADVKEWELKSKLTPQQRRMLKKD
ncbi:hypothetical protein Y032_0001g226 [Ancylostoma ceylanicum]|uniref:SXP/RAL-2 family protein Ani s 5-like cation-binding domain-containing protein n=1 Tax=Ancylostoma ceylanicum TaxID=53326 RepID=A0A016W372_9BILA|nr:hypothetical protein Y032_0001g226 [Ancylostoma ceylanicum]